MDANEIGSLFQAGAALTEIEKFSPTGNRLLTPLRSAILSRSISRARRGAG